MIKYHLHELIYFIIFLCAFALIILAWPRRKTPGGLYFVGHLVGLEIWAAGLFFDAVSTTIPTKLLGSQFSYFGFVFVTPLLFLFVLAYSTQHNVDKKLVISLMIFPVIVLIAALTNQWHHQLWSQIYWGAKEYNILVYEHGIIYYLYIAYIYIMIVFGIAVLIHYIPKYQPPFRSQLIVILIGSIFPVITGSIYALGFEPIKGMDISIFGFLLTNLFLSFGFLRYQLLDLVPVARGVLFEHLQDGVIVVDWMKRVVEINQHTIDLLNLPKTEIIGKQLAEVIPWKLDLPELSKLDEPTDYCLDTEKRKYVNIRVSSLVKGPSAPPGYLLVMRDISVQKQATIDLTKANSDLKSQLMQINQLQILLKDQASHDSLTGLYNRRAMDELLENLLQQAQKQKLNFSLAILDIDHFKRFNDIYGHQTGDYLLQEYSKIIMASIRKHDIACRFGGDEILLGFLDMQLNNAVNKADEIRKKLKIVEIEQDLSKVSTSVSIGVAAYPMHGGSIKELIRSADQALYEAKEKGRDQVVQAQLPKNDDPTIQ